MDKMPKLLSRPANELGNEESLEKLWAAKAMEHGEIYFNIICSVDSKCLRLSPHDDLIYLYFRQDFPDFNVEVIDENEMKSPVAKAKWRPFCERFRNIVEDYSFGTLMRADAKGEYTEDNTIFVHRIQFYAIEVARNREGVNDIIRNKMKPGVRPKRIPKEFHKESGSSNYNNY